MTVFSDQMIEYLPLILCQVTISIKCNSLKWRERKLILQDLNSTPEITSFADFSVSHQFCSFCSPNKEVDEDNNWEEEASAAGVWAKEQDEVTERAEQQHPQHVPFKEQKEAVRPSQHWHYMLHSGHTSWRRETLSITIKSNNLLFPYWGLHLTQIHHIKTGCVDFSQVL